MDLILKIRSFWEGKGASDAAAGVEKVGEAAKKTSPDMEHAKGSAEKAFRAIDASRQITEGGLSGLGQVIKNLGSQFPALSSAALGPIGLIIAGIAAWKKVIDTLRERHDALMESLRMIAAGNLEASIKKQTAAYAELTRQINLYADERQRASDLEQSKDDAVLRSGLARLELEKAKRLAALLPDDELGRRNVEIDIGSKRADLEDAAAKRKAEREDSDLKAEESRQRQLLVNAQQQREEAANNATKFSKQYGYLLKSTRDEMSDWTPHGREIWNKNAPELQKLADSSAGEYAKIAAAKEEERAAQVALEELRAKRGVNAIDRGTQETTVETRKWTDYTAKDNLVLDEQKGINDGLRQLNEVMSGMSAENARLLRDLVEGFRKSGQESAYFYKALLRDNEQLFKDSADAQNASRLRQ